MKISPIEMLDRIDTTIIKDLKKEDKKVMKYKSNYFIVSNYCDTRKFNVFLDSIACTLVADDYLAYYHYAIYFIKETKYTNEKYLEENPRSFYRYSISHDFIIDYKHYFNQHKGRFFKHTYTKEKEKKTSIDFICVDLVE